jgi:hypothetical protein
VQTTLLVTLIDIIRPTAKRFGAGVVGSRGVGILPLRDVDLSCPSGIGWDSLGEDAEDEEFLFTGAGEEIGVLATAKSGTASNRKETGNTLLVDLVPI